MNQRKQKRSNRDSSGSSSQLIRVLRNSYKKVRDLLSDSPLLYLPFFGLFVLNATDFVVLFEFESAALTNLFFVDEGIWTEDVDLRARVEVVKSKIKSYVLLFTFAVAFLNTEKIISFFLNNRNIMFLYIVMLASSMYSIEPAQVVSNVANIGFSLLSCILVVIYQKSQKVMIRNSMILLFSSCAVVLIGSAILFVVIQEQSFTQLDAGKRYGGITGNPNTLGLLAMIGIWAGLTILSEKTRAVFAYPIVILLLIVFVSLLLATFSATSLVLSIVAALLIFWGRIMQKFTLRTGISINIGVLVIVLFVALGVVAATSSGGNVLAIFTEALGKDSTFTGRTGLWEIGISAVKEKPIFGWSYDSHVSVFIDPRYDLILLNHFHNGYIDTLVAGGVVLFVALLIHLYSFIKKGTAVLFVDKNAYIAMMPLVFLLIHNMTEYSILRINSMLWIVFMLCYAILASYSTRNERPKKLFGSRRPKRRRRSRGYRFG